MDFKLLYKFFEGLTTQEEDETIRQWVMRSPENEKRFFEERKMFDAVVLNTTEPDINENMDCQSVPSGNRPHISIYFRELIKIAAIVAITLLGSWYCFIHINKSNKLVAMQTISVPAGQRLNIILPDGTDVWLNAKTTIKYPVSFNEKERLILLDGQAYFDVAKNKEIPFLVKTRDGIVQALGTKFDVMAYPDSHSFETVLMEGKVKVRATCDSSQSIILTPSNKAYLKNGKLETSYVDDFSAYEWKDGLISFKNESFARIMKSFEKVYDIKIIIENPQVSNLIYTGKFRVIDGVDYALRVLQKDVKFKFERDTEKHIVYIK
ncbi:MAG: FecR family protein [Prevotella sp.]|jgi:ferric-dicitrate binding protein FerR (iron transport regulator)|nr:FecR family protein [Prevotella sp.]